ncbi:fasciclin-like arabinogalactan protein 14 [Macadamia integrifolia]|uniref:fasciclin-like arabinogalactan protein 14 n=1 Tax=Macadamia integrifolia TaxID=60698 RepID=UPI001C4EDC3D|nr:fasciclin-like arabinogalactan protein 14 [Macadamia integrifolia]
MDPKCSIFSLLFLSSFLLFSHANAFNISKMLDQFPNFKNFNSLLHQAHLVREINSRQTITVLAVDDGAISGIMGKPADVLKRIMSLHVVLDYYDPKKLHKLSKKTALLTTLFQSSGQAIGRLGFLNVTIQPDGHIAFGSAIRGASIDSMFIQSVASQPYNISVLQIGAPIDPPSIETLVLPNKTAIAPSHAPAHAPKGAKSKGPSKAPISSPVEAPAPSDASADEPSADTPTSDSPADAPADSPADAPGPSDAPAGSPPAPVADVPTVDAPAPTKSGAEGSSVGSFVAFIVVGVASWFVM